MDDTMSDAAGRKGFFFVFHTSAFRLFFIFSYASGRMGFFFFLGCGEIKSGVTGQSGYLQHRTSLSNANCRANKNWNWSERGVDSQSWLDLKCWRRVCMYIQTRQNSTGTGGTGVREMDGKHSRPAARPCDRAL